MKVFLYLTHLQLDVLRYGRLHFLAVGDDLNPFLTNKKLVKVKQPKVTEADFQAELERQFKQLPANLKGLISKEQFMQGAKAKRPQIEAQLKKRLAGATPKLPSPEIYQQLASLSLGNRPDNLLLWERWAANHQGLVLELNANYPGLVHKKQVLKKVSYSNERPQANHPMQPFPALFIKPKDYAAEEEIKLIRPLEEATSSQTLTNGKQVYFYKLPPQAIVSITLGANCSKDTQDQLNKILTYDVKYKPGKPLRQAWLDPYKFKLHIKGTL